MPTTTLLGPVIGPSQTPGLPRYWRNTKVTNAVKRRKPIGAIALLGSPTSYSASRLLVNTEPDFGSSGMPGVPYYGEVGPSKALVPNALFQRIELIAKSNLRNKIKDEKWNLSTFLAELPQTQKYLIQVAKELQRAYLAMRRALKGDLAYLKRLARKGRAYLRRRGVKGAFNSGSRQISKRWLEFRYAVSPMIYDLDDMLKWLHHQAQRPMLSRAAAGATDNWQDLIRGSGNNPSYVNSCSCQGRAVCYFNVACHADALKRLGLINLAATLWEVTPFSFVVDMFLPVGEFVGQLDAMAGVSVLSSTYSEAYTVNALRTRVTFPARYHNGTEWVYYNFQYGGSSGKLKAYSRGPSPVTANFAFTQSPTGKQLVDICALVRTVLLPRG